MSESDKKPIRRSVRTGTNACILKPFIILVSVLLLFLFGPNTQGQSGRHRLYGEVKLEQSGRNGPISVNPNASFDVILYSLSGSTLGRQSVFNKGQYQFLNVPDGQYDLAIEFQNKEIGRVRVRISAALGADVCQNIELDWNSAGISRKPATVSVEDFYERSGANQKQFEKAGHAIDKKRYAEATTLLKTILANDPNDFQSWTELGTLYLAQSVWGEAEAAYVRATELSPGFFVALLDLGRLRIMRRDFVGTIPILLRAVEMKANSADANYYLGEAYLQVKNGSKAVTYFYEALKLDPIGKAQAHLRLAALYNAAGLKDRAGIEYQEFLRKHPNYENRKRLEQYIKANLHPLR
jgi:tetratricopeptide (TPR) repeat protein